MTQQLKDLLRRLANWEAPQGTAITSVFLDSRSEASGERPGERTSAIRLKDRLHELEKQLLPRGPALDSFRIDRELIQESFDNADPAAEGIAVFSCGAANLFEVVSVGTPFNNRIAYQQHAVLFPLARLIDQFEPAVVALADTSTIRIFSVRLGAMEEVAGRDKDSINFRKRQTGGFSQARYQRHIQKHREDFAAEAAGMIAAVMEEDGATRLILAGDEVAIPLLRGALPRQLRDKLTGDALRIHIRAPRDEVAAEVAGLLEQAENEDSLAAAEVLVGEVLGDDLGVAGEAATRRALQSGSVDILVVRDNYEPAATREEFTRLAIQGGARVEVVGEHQAFDHLGGIGAILRYRA